MKDVRVYRGADVNSDHYLVATSIKLKLRKNITQSRSKRFDILKLKTPQVKKDFILEVKNRFNILSENEADEPDESVERKWEHIKNTYVGAAEKVLGFKNNKNKPWITATTWSKIEERKNIKEKQLTAVSQRIKDRLEVEYQRKDKEVKKSARKDKRNYVEDLGSEADQAAIRGDFTTVYKITKQLIGSFENNSSPIMDKKGNLLTTEREQSARWVEYFKEVLNHPEPDDPACPPQTEDLEIDLSIPTENEIRKAVLGMKNGKSPGIDNIHAEMLKADTTTTTEVLCVLFHKIWQSETIPNDWAKGLIVKLPKKGDKRMCDNWRGITLLSIPGKIFCRILLDRIDKAIDTRLRQEQAGFRKGKGCIDQIFTLRNIIEQCLEWNAPLFISFIDFRKAFDSVHRVSLWNILQHYGLPGKIVALIKLFYEKFECSVLLDNSVSESFPVNSGVRQGCILSPLLFVILIDWIMKRTTHDQARGIQWTMFTKLEDLDFADDIALLSTTRSQMQTKMERLKNFAQQTGLVINKKKTEAMMVNVSPETPPLSLNGELITSVEDFTYLGSVISKDNGAQKDIQARLNKARGAFARLRPIWKSKTYSHKTKMHIYNSNVKIVLLYGAECWRVTQKDMEKVEVFHNSCLRRIYNIFWPNKISNEALYERAGSYSIVSEIKRRRLRWLGHVLRMPQHRIPKVALRWTPPGKRKRGRPKHTWRRTVIDELDEMKLTWGEAERKAQDRYIWRGIVEASCPTPGRRG